MTDEQQSIYLMGVLDQSREKVEMNYLLALSRGDEDPVVLVLDPRDHRARAMLAWYDRPERVAATLATAAERGMVPLVISGLPRREAVRIAEGYLPGLEEAFDRQDAGDGFHVVVVGSRGYMVEAMPPVPE